MRFPLLAACLLAAPLPTGAQEEHGSHPEHGSHAGNEQPTETESKVLAVMEQPRGRTAMGTSWQPDTTPMRGVHWDVAGWGVMLNALLYGGYDVQGGPRGDSQVVGLGWVMAMAERTWTSDRLKASVMLSPEPFTAGHEGGYPLLLQTGETFEGKPLVDRQHPHDLFMELSLTYTHALSKDWAVQVYAAPVGEPALGPVAFPHRQSALYDPLAPLGHHWQDSTHIAFGVLTAGVITPSAKLEASWFNGREPDEDRYDLDLRRPDSFSVRLSANPTRRVSAQVSFGRLASPEALEPEVSVTRLTTSVMYGQPRGAQGHWATTAIFGRNLEGEDGQSSAALLESSLDLDGRNIVFGRVEYAEKMGNHLALPHEMHELHERNFGVGGLVLGYVRNFGPLGPVVPGVGVRGAIHLVPEALQPFYGSRTPVGGMVYLRLTSVLMEHGGHAGQEEGGMHMP